MDTLDTLIIGGTVVTPHSTQKLNIGISNGILCELLNPSITESLLSQAALMNISILMTRVQPTGKTFPMGPLLVQ